MHSPAASPPEPTSRTEPAAEVLEWRVHLARRQPVRGALALGAAAAAGLWGLLLFGSPLGGVAGFGLVLAAVGEFVFPTRYRLTPEGAEVQNPFAWRRIAWSDVKRVYTGEGEIKLSPLAHGGPREAFRGVVLRCHANRDEVLAAVRRFRDAGTGS